MQAKKADLLSWMSSFTPTARALGAYVACDSRGVAPICGSTMSLARRGQDTWLLPSLIKHWTAKAVLFGMRAKGAIGYVIFKYNKHLLYPII